jgi:hypothetical protein
MRDRCAKYFLQMQPGQARSVGSSPSAAAGPSFSHAGVELGAPPTHRVEIDPEDVRCAGRNAVVSVREHRYPFLDGKRGCALLWPCPKLRAQIVERRHVEHLIVAEGSLPFGQEREFPVCLKRKGTTGEMQGENITRLKEPKALSA